MVEKRKNKKLLTEGTSNFWIPPEGLPLLVGLTIDEYDDMVSYYETNGDGEDYEPDFAILDGRELRKLEKDIDDFIDYLSEYNDETYDYDNDYDIYISNKYAIKDGIERLIEIKSGYYEGFQIFIRKSYSDLSKDLQGMVKSFLDKLKLEYNLTELSTNNRFVLQKVKDDEYVSLDESKKTTK